MNFAQLLSYCIENGISFEVQSQDLEVITSNSEALTEQVVTALKRYKPEIIQWLSQLEAEKHKAPSTMTPCPDAPYYELSFVQKRLWLIDKFQQGSAQYNMCSALLVKGPLNIPALQDALNELIIRHEPLRTSYHLIDGQPKQRIDAPTALSIEHLDITSQTKELQLERIESEIAFQQEIVFRLDRDLMLKIKLIKCSHSVDEGEENQHVLLVTTHHIAADGWSFSILIKDLKNLYNQLVDNHLAPLTSAELNYRDYAHWQNRRLTGAHLDKLCNYWREQLAGLPPVHNLPLDRIRPYQQTFSGAVYKTYINRDLTEGINQLGAKSDATLFMALYAVYSVLLARWSNEADIAVGTPVANRSDSSVADMFGCFVNTIVLRSNVSENLSFKRYLEKVKHTTSDALAYQEMPLELLLDKLDVDRSGNYHPLFQTMFVLQNTESVAMDFHQLQITTIDIARITAKFDLSLIIEAEADTLKIEWEYNTQLFDSETIARLASSYNALLDGVVRDPEQTIFNLPLLCEPEKTKVYQVWNDTDKHFNDALTMHGLFERQVLDSPNATALICARTTHNTQLTFAQLNERANRIAHHLLTFKEAQSPSSITHDTDSTWLIGVCLPEGDEAVIALLGVLKAGGAYLPLDPAYPSQRLHRIVSQSATKLVVTKEKYLKLFDASLNCIALDAPHTKYALNAAATGNPIHVDNDATLRKLAYVIYTSGSTGNPKGVAIQHNSAVNTLNDINDRFNVCKSDKILALSSLSFDLSVYDIFGVLSAGGSVVIPEYRKRKDFSHWLALISQYDISLWNTVPASMELLTQHMTNQNAPINLTGLRLVLMSGDYISPKLPSKISQYFPSAKIISLGGATEASIWSIIYPIPLPWNDKTQIPYGRPMANQQFYVLNDYLQPCPVSVEGELYIGGKGLAREYYKDLKRTSDSFVQHPFLKQRLYKTGDLGKYHADGTIAFCGRKDSQIKLSGFRIELGEIENTLEKSHLVESAVVIITGEQEDTKALTAYVTLSDQGKLACSQSAFEDHTNTAYPSGAPELQSIITEIKVSAIAHLPQYMVPRHIIVLASFPLNINGKLDRKALPQPDKNEFQCTAMQSPDNEIERGLEHIITRILKCDTVCVERAYFELGLNSLHFLILASEIKEMFSVELEVYDLYNSNSIRLTAKVIDERQKTNQELLDFLEQLENS